MSTWTILAAALGGLFGLLADRLSARWPDQRHMAAARHETAAGMRPFDWRTLAVVAGGAVSLAALAHRWSEPQDLAVLAVYLGALVILLATDLEHRLLPDVITLPLIPYGLVLLLLDANPLLAGTSMPVAVGIATGLAAPAVLLLTDRLFRGGLGMGDVKLAVSLGLVCGASRLLTGFLVASVAASLLILALLAARRLERRSAIPFGPILIGAGIVGTLLY